jgi:hypothetical protein
LRTTGIALAAFGGVKAWQHDMASNINHDYNAAIARINENREQNISNLETAVENAGIVKSFEDAMKQNKSPSARQKAEEALISIKGKLPVKYFYQPVSAESWSENASGMKDSPFPGSPFRAAYHDLSAMKFEEPEKERGFVSGNAQYFDPNGVKATKEYIHWAANTNIKTLSERALQRGVIFTGENVARINAAQRSLAAAKNNHSPAPGTKVGQQGLNP